MNPDRAALLRPVRLPPSHERILENGFKVITATHGSLPLASVQLLIEAGSRCDPRRKRGLADFVARLLKRGAGRRNGEQLGEAIEGVGASLAADADEDNIGIGITLPAEELERMLAILADMVIRPTFPAREVAKARDRAVAELSNDLDEPALVADRTLVRAVWGDHPYGHDPAGVLADVAGFRRSDLAAFHRARFGPQVTTLVIAGAVEPARAERAARATFGGWSGGAAQRVEAPSLAEAAMAGQVLIVDKPGQTQTQIRLGQIGFPRGHADEVPAAVANTVLGGGFTSRLVEEIRVKRGLSYGAGSAFARHLSGGAFSVSTFTRTETTREAVDVVLGVARALRREGPTARELADARRYLAGMYALRFESNGSVASALAQISVFGLGRDWVERYRERVMAVTRRRAKEISQRYFFDRPPAVVLVGDARAIRGQLRGLGPVRVARLSEVV